MLGCRYYPWPFVEYAQSVLTSIFFGSNFFFYFSTTEYGSESALLKPFLHTWSLGVEEQFYLAFPVVSLVVYKFFKDHFFCNINMSHITYQISCFNESITEYSEERNEFYQLEAYKSSTTLIVSTRYSQDSRCGAPYKNLMSTNDLDGLRFLIDRARRDGKKVVVMGNTAEFSPIEGSGPPTMFFSVTGALITLQTLLRLRSLKMKLIVYCLSSCRVT